VKEENKIIKMMTIIIISSSSTSSNGMRKGGNKSASYKTFDTTEMNILCSDTSHLHQKLFSSL
jgi:hypothetical protein